MQRNYSVVIDTITIHIYYSNLLKKNNFSMNQLCISFTMFLTIEKSTKSNPWRYHEYVDSDNDLISNRWSMNFLSREREWPFSMLTEWNILSHTHLLLMFFFSMISDRNKNHSDCSYKERWYKILRQQNSKLPHIAWAKGTKISCIIFSIDIYACSPQLLLSWSLVFHFSLYSMFVPCMYSW